MNEYIIKEQKRLRYGYTTGSCAAAAAKAATRMLMEQKNMNMVSLMTPKGILLNLEVKEANYNMEIASCGVKKDSGDDPDVTNGIMVYASIEKVSKPGIIIDGGIGVGRITKKGLEQGIGEAAINKIPRMMIREAVEEEVHKYHYEGGLNVIISIPEGVEIAKKTFNPRLGIEGGISILGTSGIVEPMSEDAIRETIHLEIKMRSASGDTYLLTTPGNYGEDFSRDILGISMDKSIKCSNYIGDTIDYAIRENLEGMILIGHIGKLVKLAGGIMNTHSKHGDCRMEILTAYTAIVGGDHVLLSHIMNSITTDEALDFIKEAGLLEGMMKLIMERILFHMNKRAQDKLKIGVITFSNQHGILGQTKGVEELLCYIS